MSSRIPEADAFALYIAMGDARSYSAVGAAYGVSKRSITKLARRDNWAERLAKIQESARRHSDEKLGESLAETRERHLKLVRAMAMRAARAIQEHPLDTGWEGIRAAELAIKMERLILNQPNERTAVTVEQTTKAEMDRFLVKPGEDEPDGDDADDGDGEY